MFQVRWKHAVVEKLLVCEQGKLAKSVLDFREQSSENIIIDVA